MRYCTDTWFILKAFYKDAKASSIIEETKKGKTYLIIPIVTFAEATKKLLQRGVSQDIINKFFEGAESSDKVELVFADKILAQEVAKISLTYSLSIMDSFVAATAKMCFCDAILSGDKDYSTIVKRKYMKVQSW